MCGDGQLHTASVEYPHLFSYNPDCDWKILEAHLASCCSVLHRALPGSKTGGHLNHPWHCG